MERKRGAASLVPDRNQRRSGTSSLDSAFWPATFRRYRKDDMKNARALLKRTQEELQSARALLKQKTRAVANADDEHEKETAKLGRKIIKTAIKGLEQHRAILKTETAK
jgi:hypothetical protein